MKNMQELLDRLDSVERDLKRMREAIYGVERTFTESDFQAARDYESGFRAGSAAGRADRLAKLRSSLYWPGRDARPNWYEQGYNNGYLAGGR